MRTSEKLIRFLLSCLSSSGLTRAMARRYAGRGGILSFHRICHAKTQEYGSRGLSVTPENFRRIVQTLIEQDYRFLSMSGLAAELLEPRPTERKFVCLTFDDGFADNYTEAFPICREFGVPMTVYLVSSFVRREFPMWSFGLEAVIAANDGLELAWQGEELRLECRTLPQKQQAYFAVASRFYVASPEKIRQACAELGRRYGVDFLAQGDPHVLTPSMIAEMHASGWVEFGAHSVHHARLRHLPDNAARWEIEQARHQCEAIVGTQVRHFAYPYGGTDSAGPREFGICRAAGFDTGVTTESNTIFPSDRDRLWSLPRLTYSGSYQDAPLLDLLLSGTLPFFRRYLR